MNRTGSMSDVWAMVLQGSARDKRPGTRRAVKSLGVPVAAALLVLLVLLAAICGGPIGVGDAAAQQRVPQSREEISLSFAPLVRQAAPAVVNIEARRVETRSAISSPLFDDPFFRQFFGDPGRPRTRQSESVGSGVIVEPDGLIVTNHHVIAEADEITVILADRRQFTASLVRDDPRTDLAILQIDIGGETLPFISLADSDELEVGELVLAIGNPFGVGQTVTSGIVSALARTNRGISDFSFFIQTDAAINPGNSGGALLRMDGTLAGVNTAIFSQTGGSQGIGFAIPANMVRTVIASVGVAGGLQRPWLGAQGRSVDVDIAEELGLTRPAGVLISRIYPGGPADRADLQPGDVVVAVDDRPVDDVVALNFRLATADLGTAVTLMVLRGGQPRELRLPVEPPLEEPAPQATLIEGPVPLDGATVANLSPALADEIGVDPFLEGVVILSVGTSTVARRLGLRAFDIVREINGVAVDDVDGLVELMQTRPDLWEVVFERDDRLLSLRARA